MVVKALIGFGAIINSILSFSAFNGLIPVALQSAGIVLVIAAEFNAPEVVKALPLRITPGLITPTAPLFETIVPQKME
jgi:hypothetical protein